MISYYFKSKSYYFVTDLTLYKTWNNMDQESRVIMMRVPLTVVSVVFNFCSIFGNTVVLHIFRRKYDRESNYRLFVLLLASFDMAISIFHVIKEQFRRRVVFFGGVTILCPIMNYVGHSIGMGNIFMVLFIAVERYKKICTPFQSQFTVRQSSVICAVAIFAGAVLNIPIFIIFGTRSLTIGGFNATRCCMIKAYDQSAIPVIHFGFLNILVLSVVIVIVIIQCKIRAVILRQSAMKKKRKNFQEITKEKFTNSFTSFSETQDTAVEFVETIQVSAITNSRSIKEYESGKEVVLKSRSKASSEENQAVRVTITFSIITALLIISFQALFMYHAVLAASRFFHTEDHISWNRDLFNIYFPDIATLNGALNPFVYYFTDIKFKREVKRMFRR